MGATAFRPKKSSSRRYKLRREARLRGEPMASRTHEGTPWFQFAGMVFEPAPRVYRKEDAKTPHVKERT